MPILPSRGRCYAAFLLAYSARLKPAKTFDSWVDATIDRSTILAVASDIVGTAHILLKGNLATVKESVVLDRRLARFSEQADRVSLVSIARLLIRRFPPSWISSSVVDGEFAPEFIPETDLEQLSWLDSDLERIVLDVYFDTVEMTEGELRSQIGEAGELAIMSALKRVGKNPSRVSLISDSYGYDIEYQYGNGLRRVEVKACVETTSNRVIVSRNEYEKSTSFAASWSLVQVCFSTAIIVKRRVICSDILFIRELSPQSLVMLSPPSTNDFRWIEAAEFSPANSMWKRSSLRVADDFTVELGK